MYCADFEGWMVSAGNGTITAEDGKMSELWSARYSIIRKCCRLLENMDKAYFVDEPAHTRIQMMTEFRLSNDEKEWKQTKKLKIPIHLTITQNSDNSATSETSADEETSGQ